MNIKFLKIRNWDYELYQVNDNLVITVVFFGQIDYSRSFYLPNDTDIQESSLIEIAEHIRNNYEMYKAVEISPPISLTKAEIEGQQ